MAPNGGQVVLGLILAWQRGYLVQALTFQKPVYTIGIGVWLAPIMAFNVWFRIWPDQQKVFGLVEASADAKAAAGRLVGFGPNCVTLVIAVGAERGQNSVVTIAAGLPSGTEVGLGRRRMSVVLLILGIVAAAAGTATIGFGITINEFTLGTASIIAGTTGLTGGLILIGLSAVVAELGRVGEALRARGGARPVARLAEAAEPAPPAPVIAAATSPAVAAGARPPQQANVPPPPRPRPEAPVARPAESYPQPGPSAVEVSAAAIERLRSSIPRAERPTERTRTESPATAHDEEVPLSPNGAGHHPAQPSRPSNVEAAPSELRGSADDRIGAAPSEALKASRLDFLFRSKAARPAPQSENFDTFWPADAAPGRSAGAEPQPRSDENQRYADYAPSVQARPPVQAAPVQASPGYDRRAEPAPAETAAILKSGVVDGMAYTLYSDGSIEARLPHGTVRFGSIGELRSHIESNS